LGIAILRASLGGFVLVAFKPGNPQLIGACLAAFVLAEASDLADGAIARRLSTPNLFGYLQDSIADKLFNFGCLLALSRQFEFMPFIVWGLLTREFLILATRILDRNISSSLKRLRTQVVLYAVFVRVGIFGFLVQSVVANGMAAILETLSYAMLLTAVVFGAINIAQTISISLKSPAENET